MCDKVECDKAVCDQVVCEGVVCDKFLCDKDVCVRERERLKLLCVTKLCAIKLHVKDCA